MKAKTKEQWTAGLISLVVGIITAIITSNLVIRSKLNDGERDKLNSNFQSLKTAFGKTRDQQVRMTFLLSKLVYTNKTWKQNDFKEAMDLIADIKAHSDFDFDAMTMSLGDEKGAPCESFREFYKKNRQMIHENHLPMLRNKIEHCIPESERLPFPAQ